MVDSQDFLPHGGYRLVAVPLKVDLKLPAEISQHVRLDRATDEQILQLKRLSPPHPIIQESLRHRFEVDWEERPTAPDQSEFIPHPLSKENWRYFVLTYAGSGKELFDACKIFQLHRPPITFDTLIHTSAPFGAGEVRGRSLDPFATVNHSPGLITPGAAIVTQESFDDLKQTLEQYRELTSKQSYIARCVDMIDDLRFVAKNTGLYALGLFAILELLLTHKPNDRENADSLNHQLGTKVPLLAKRMDAPLDYSNFVDGLSEQKIWGGLYEYRSRIAHGGTILFDDKELRNLRGVNQVHSFLSDATRKLVRHGLKEPTLVEDLKRV